MNFINRVIIISALSLATISSFAGDLPKINLNSDGSNYVKFSCLFQGWARYQEYNDGTTIYGYPKNGGLDLGIRRFRMTVSSQITDRVYLYGQIGENNYNNITPRKFGLFVHDAVGEYAVVKKYFSLGMGLTGWGGFSRYSAPSTGTIMGIDAPLFSQSTNDITDNFLRKLSIYGKGKLGKLDYRVAISQPLAVQNAAASNYSLSPTGNFSPLPPKIQMTGYFSYQFLDQESNTSAYNIGTYLGSKKVFNVGVGGLYQKDAIWALNATNDTIFSPLTNLCLDVFYDAPVGNKGEAVNIYGNYSYMNFGTNYLRNQGVMNPANGSNQSTILNGGGSAYPAIGTGHTAYLQVGYKLKDSLIGTASLMPYIATQTSFFDKLNTPMVFIDAGTSILLNKNNAKVTIAYQNRPQFLTNGETSGRKSGVVMQLQVFLN